MSLMRYRDPFEEFRVLSDTIFNDFFKTVSWENVGKGFPTYDQYENEDGSVVLEFPLAGYKASELSVNVEGQRLSIIGQKSNGETDSKKTHRIPRKSFERILAVDRTLDLESLKASFEDGLLKVVIPIRESEKPKLKKIEITTPDKLLEAEKV